MSLRKRTLVLISLVMVGLLVALYVASQFIVLGSFENQEISSTQRNLQRTKHILGAELDDMQGTALDWTEWDDMYAFMADSNRAFRDSNLTDSTFTTTRMNAMLLVNNAGSVLYKGSYDLSAGEPVPFPRSLDQHLTSGGLLRYLGGMGVITGIVSLPESPMLVVSAPVLTSEGEGPPHGTLIFGRYLNNAEIQRLSHTILYSLSLYQVGDPQLPADFRAALGSMSAAQPVSVDTRPDDTISGYALFNDIYAKPAFMLRVDMPRTLYAQGVQATLYFVLVLALAGLAFGIAIMYILERGVLSRVARLSSSASMIAARRDPSLRVMNGGKDELSRLASDINRMLDALESSQQQQLASERRYRDLMEQASDGILVAYPGEKFLEANSAICKILDYTPEELKGLSIEDIVVQSDMPAIYAMHEEVKAGSTVMLEVDMVRKDGTMFTAEISASGINDGRIQGIIRDITERKLYERRLRENASAQALLLKQLMNAQEAERRRLSMDIHDGPLQMLGVSLMALDRAARRTFRGENSLANQELDYLRTTLRETVNEVRAVLADLSQDTLRTYGLVVAVQNHINRFEEVTGIQVELKSSLEHRLLADLELLLYRLLQESLANVRKHSRAGKAEVVLQEEGENIILRVSDNGIGFVVEDAFDRHEEGQGIGLRSMVERVEGAGGSLLIDSSPGLGTTLEFTVRMPPKTTPLTTANLQEHALASS